VSGQQIFSLAGVIFDYRYFEVPQDFAFGLETMGSIHSIPQTDGAPPKRIVQTFGVFPAEMTWEAKLLGANAEDKLAVLEAKQTQQQVVPLVMGRRSWDVVIFKVGVKEYRSRYDITIAITVKPLTYRAGTTPNGQIGQGASSNLRLQQQALLSLVSDSAAQASNAATVQANMAAFQAAINAAQPEQQQTIATLLSLQAAATTVVTSAQALHLSLSSSTGNAALLTGIWAAKVVGAAQSYNASLSSYVGTDASAAIPVNPGTSCYTLAATYLGDWSRYGDIMSINGLTDPFITTGMTLNMPRT
jgi:hypothetical protein